MSDVFRMDLLWREGLPMISADGLSAEEKNNLAVSTALRLVIEKSGYSPEDRRKVFLRAWGFIEPLGPDARETFAYALIMAELAFKSGVMSTGTRPGPCEPFSGSPELESVLEGILSRIPR